MNPKMPRYNDSVVAALRSAVTDGNFGLSDVPALLKRVIREDMWCERELTQTGEQVHFTRFVDFVRERPLEGLGASVEQLQRLCADDPEALDLLDQVLQVQSRPGRRTDLFDNIKEVGDPPTGTSRSYALRRLRKARPDLHARVLIGELSPHRAMVEAGFRDVRLTIPRDVTKAAAAITRAFTIEEVTQLITLLSARER